MPGVKKKRQSKRNQRTNQTTKNNASNKRNISNRRCHIIAKNFDIFVTDFLTDPCGLPVELRNCVLVDGTSPLNDTSGLYEEQDGSLLHIFQYFSRE